MIVSVLRYPTADSFSVLFFIHLQVPDFNEILDLEGLSRYLNVNKESLLVGLKKHCTVKQSVAGSEDEDQEPAEEDQDEEQESASLEKGDSQATLTEADDNDDDDDESEEDSNSEAAPAVESPGKFLITDVSLLCVIFTSHPLFGL
jgi:hypothetical protein